MAEAARVKRLIHESFVENIEITSPLVYECDSADICMSKVRSVAAAACGYASANFCACFISVRPSPVYERPLARKQQQQQRLMIDRSLYICRRPLPPPAPPEHHRSSENLRAIWAERKWVAAMAAAAKAKPSGEWTFSKCARQTGILLPRHNFYYNAEGGGNSLVLFRAAQLLLMPLV